LNTTLINKHNFDIYIRSIDFKPHLEGIKLESNVKTLVDLQINDNNLLKISPFSSFSLPVNIKSSIQTNNIGSIVIQWDDTSLKNFDHSIVNSIEIQLPEISIDDLGFDLKITTISQIKIGDFFDMGIRVINTKEEFRKFVLLVDTSHTFIINGPIKKRFIIKPKEELTIPLFLVGSKLGHQRLPLFKVMEYEYNTAHFDNKLHSIYYFSDYIQITN
jgi:hypothetical protein